MRIWRLGGGGVRLGGGFKGGGEGTGNGNGNENRGRYRRRRGGDFVHMVSEA